MNRMSRISKFIRNFEKMPREYFLLTFILAGVFVIIYNIFSYTVINGAYYKELADKQQISKISVPVNRGNVYFSTNSSKTTIATSLSLDNLAIDPSVKGDKQKLTFYLRDIVYKQVCEGKGLNECYNGLLKFTKQLEIPNFQLEETFIKNIILDEIIKKVNKTKVTSVVIGEDLSTGTIDDIIRLNLPGITVVENDVYGNPEEIVDLASTVTKLKDLLDYSTIELTALLTPREIKYVPIINRLNINISDEINSYISDERQAIKQKVLSQDDSISGFIILSGNPSRYYPESALAGSVVGFVDSTGVGRYGIEGYYNDELKGNNGQIIAREDTSGRVIDSNFFGEETEATAGIDITLTIDRNIQKKVEEVIEGGVKMFKANKGSIIVMDPKTGNILAMANYPSFDLNYTSDVYDLEKVSSEDYPNPKEDLRGKVVFVEDTEEGEIFYYNGQNLRLREAKNEEIDDPLIVKYKYKNDFGAGVYNNYIVSDLYEPGSIMKAITVAVGLDTGEITRYDMYQDNMEVTIDGFTIRNASRSCAGYNSLNHALIFSCNVGMIRIVQRIGRALFNDYQKAFGFGQPTGIQLAGEVYSELPNYDKRSRAQLFTMSYGLGISTTQIQMAAAYAVLANGGVYVKPNIIKQIKMQDGSIIKYKPEILRRVIKESTAKIITSMLVDSIENGLAENGKVKGYNLAGKTGTAQIAAKGGYEDGVGSTIGSFAGYGPAEDPKFVIVTKLERPRTTVFGGESSAYMFAEISKYLLDYYGIPASKPAELLE